MRIDVEKGAARRVCEPFSVREHDSLRPAVHAQLGQDPLDVGPDGLRADDELAGDVELRQAPGEKLEHLTLACRQRRQPRSAVAGGCAAGRARSRAAVPHRASDPGEQLAFVERLHHVVVCADQEPCNAIVGLGAVARDEDDRDLVGERVAQLTADFVTADAAEVDFQENERRVLAAGDFDGLAAVLGLDRAVPESADQLGKSRSADRVAVGDEYAGDRTQTVSSSESGTLLAMF